MNETTQDTGETDAEAPIFDRRDDSKENLFKRSIFSVPVTVNVLIGSTRVTVANILEMRPDSVIPLSAKIDDPVELRVEDRLIARGELFEPASGEIGVKITEIIDMAIEG